MSRTIIFGDIHGCYEEWQDLLAKAGPKPKDRLICVGDLVFKGPSTRKTLDLAMKLKNLTCILGNHDHRLLEAWKNRKLESLHNHYQKEAIAELGKDIDRYMNFIAAWPFFVEHPHFAVVHAGIRAGVPLKQQKHSDLLTLRTLEDGRPWFETYREERLIVHGHWARMGLVVRDNVIGLDTGCVYGRELTCVVLPERKILSVPAKRTYLPV